MTSSSRKIVSGVIKVRENYLPPGLCPGPNRELTASGAVFCWMGT